MQTCRARSVAPILIKPGSKGLESVLDVQIQEIPESEILIEFALFLLVVKIVNLTAISHAPGSRTDILDKPPLSLGRTSRHSFDTSRCSSIASYRAVTERGENVAPQKARSPQDARDA